MPRIQIKSPDQIRAAVNSAKQQQRQQRHGGRRYKRCTMSTDLLVDFNQSPVSKSMQASDLATLIECSGRLESISLEHVRIEGDWNLVLTALKESEAAQHLRTFSSYSCNLREDAHDMIQLGEALSHIPRLVGVSLGLSHMKHQPAWKILTPIVSNCASLTKIFVNGFYGPPDTDRDANQEVVDFLQAVAASTSLKRLLCLPMLGRSFGSREILDAVAHLIRTNRSIEVLELYVRDGTPVVHLAEALKSNSSLLRLALTGRHASRNSQQEMDAFYRCFQEHNYTLRELLIEPWSRELSSPLHFELSLNRMGRHRLLNQGASTDEWMDAIADKDDTSIIYYFLRKNPALCDPKNWVDDDDEDDDEVSCVYSSTSEENGRARPPIAYRRMQAAMSRNAYVPPPRPPVAVVSPQVTSPLYKNNSRKRSIEELEDDGIYDTDEDFDGYDSDDYDEVEETPATAGVATGTTTTTAAPPSSLMGVVTKTAYTAAVFAAGFWFRGVADQS